MPVYKFEMPSYWSDVTIGDVVSVDGEEIKVLSIIKVNSKREVYFIGVKEESLD